MQIRELLTKWGFQVDEKPLHNIEKQLEGIKHRLEFLAAAQVIKGVYELTERFSKFAEELHVAADSAGITVEKFQKLAFAAQQNAVSQEEMSGAMARLSRQLYAARIGGVEAQQAFAQAGFTPEQISGFHTSSDVMLALADSFQKNKDPIQKQAIAMELMGRGSINMVGFLSKGSGAIKGMGTEAERLGIILSHGQVEALVETEHALQKFWGVIKAIGATIASYFAPSIKSAIAEFLKFYQVNRKIIDVNIRAWVWNVTYAMGAIWAVVKFVTEVFLKFAKALGFDKNILTLVFSIGSLVAALTAIGTVLPFITGAFESLFLLFSPWTLAITGAVVALQALWTVLKGGNLKDTWVGKLLGGIDFGGIFSKASSGLGNLVGIGGGDIKSNASSVAPGSSASNSNYSVSAPISISVPPGTDPKEVGKAAKEGIREHLDRVYRQTSQVTTGAIAY